MLAHTEVEQHFAVFQDLVAQADNYLRRGKYNTAAVYAEIAATYATHHHAGLFVSPKLEQALLSIGRKIANKTLSPESKTLPGATSRHVLHVLTEAAGIGGHTRMVWRWIQQDSESRHSVVLTRQGFVRVPQALKDAIDASNGNIYLLNKKIGNILTWSQELRKIAMAADVVVLHIYTDDVIPLIAFADKRYIPPIIFLNHTDHKFWLGVSISDIVAHQRYSGFWLSQTRRGIEGSKCGFLPVALTPTPRKFSISEAKKQIGLAEETLLLLSIARPAKYVPLREYGSRVNDLVLPDSVLPVLQKYPDTALIVIGPEHTDRWERASQTVQGRIKALGKREDTAIFYQAADIYLDSFPFSSITSLLEAANYGVPLVSCHPYSDVSDVLCADTPALMNTMIRARSVSEYISAISRLVEDMSYRTYMGESTRQQVLAVHSGDGWKRALRDLYLQAASVSTAITMNDRDDQKSVNELDILLLDVHRTAAGLDKHTQDHLRLLPFDVRLNLWVQMLKEQHMFSPSFLLPEWLAIRLIRAQASVRNRFI